MGRVIDFIRGHLFWVLMAVLALVIAVVYVFVARGMTHEVEKKRQETRVNIQKLREWAEKTEIPNKGMIAAARREQKKLKTVYGRLLMLFGPRAGFSGGDFPALKEPGPFDAERALRWWDQYERRTAQLLEETDGKFKSGERVLRFASRDPRADKNAVMQLQDEYWLLKYVVGALSTASPKTAPLIEELVSLRPTSVSKRQLPHNWLHMKPVTVTVRMRYEKLALLIAALQNSPRPVMVGSYAAVPAARAPVAGGAEPAAPTDVLQIVLYCEPVEFKPVVQEVSFSGSLFGNTAAVRQWLKTEATELNVAMGALLEGAPALKQRAEAELGSTLEQARAAVQKKLELKLSDIDEAGKERLADLIKTKATTKDGKIDPKVKKDIEEREKRRVKRDKTRARQKSAEELLRVPGRAGGFGLAYLYLHPLLPHKAYFVGDKASDTNLLLVRAPDDARYGHGRWWVARYGKTYARTERGDKIPRKRIIAELLRKGPGKLAHVASDRSAPDKLRLFADAQTGDVVQVLLGEPGNRWKVYPVVKVGGKPASVSDVAFRFAHVIELAERQMGSVAPDARPVRVQFSAPGSVTALDEYEVLVKDGSAGTMKIRAGLRK